ncbi:MAG: hypothetical protein ACUVQT_10745, partial [bacterium]
MVNKISAVWLLMVMIGGFGQGTKPGVLPWQKYVEQELCISGDCPKVGDVFEVIYRLKLKLDVEPKSGNYCAVLFCVPPGAVEIIGKARFFFSSLNDREWKEFHTQCRILKPVGGINFDIGIYQTYPSYPDRYYGPFATTQMFLYLLDPQTGQYGTREEYERGLSVEYRYDFIDGSFIGRYDHSRVSLEENRRIIRMMKEIEPALTDSLALLLHSEQYKVGVPKGTARWDSLNQRWDDRAVFEYYLRDGWLNAVGEGRLEDWQKNEKKKIQAEWKGGSGSKFFRADSNYH